MPRDFQGKVAIVTGGASGIGLATAVELASRGAAVVSADLKASEADEKPLLAAGGGGAWAVQCDVSQEEQVQRVVDGAIERFGRLDVIVNNAGLMIFKALEDHQIADWLRILQVDLLGAFLFMRAGFRVMKGGSIVNVSSVHAIETTPLVSSYAAAKAALLSLTRSGAIEGEAKGIRVNAVLPGAVDTPMLWENPNIKSGAEKVDPHDVGKPEQVADAIVFLASDEASFIRGASLRVDGGRLDHL